MKALTLTEPWATLVAIGAKRIETRSWGTDYRGPIAIHAAKGITGADVKFAFLDPVCRGALIAGGVRFPEGARIPTLNTVFRGSRGMVIATAELVHCVRIREGHGPTPQSLTEKWGCHPDEMQFGDYTPGRFAWMLRDVVALPKPIPATGALGLWDWTPPAELRGAA